MFLFKVVDLKNSVYEAHLISWKLKQSHFIVFKNFIVKGNCLIKIMMVIGYMLRKCIDVDGEPTWGRPNFEHCVSQAMKNIFNEVLVIMISIKERCGAFSYENVYLSFQNYPNLLYLAKTRVYKIRPKDEDKKYEPQ